MKFLLALLIATPLSAGELSDVILAPGTLSGLDGPLTYDRNLGGESATLTLRPGPRLTLMLDGRPVGEFAAESAHPAVMFFLESTVRHMAEATGGSPFYIRNRIRDALAKAPLNAPVMPFAEDPNRAQMGQFAGLTLTFRTEGAEVLQLSADTAAGTGGYHESLTLVEGD
ncbi:hypothetical protein QCN27_18790 [Cereibacter sp. SYSU M97828]|nr:hypothetical protein [Cereibacter flavus]